MINLLDFHNENLTKRVILICLVPPEVENDKKFPTQQKMTKVISVKLEVNSDRHTLIQFSTILSNILCMT